MGKSKQQTLTDNTNAWLDGLAKTGLDTTFPMPAMGSLFAVVTSGFGVRDGKAINALASSNHEAHDMTVVTRAHYNDTKKYPLLRGSIEEILTNFPGLRPQFEAQLEHYKTPDDIKNVPVKSMVGGVVLYAGKWNSLSGDSIMIGGDDGRMYSYAHLADASYKVKEGQRVERGQEIALMDHPTGNTRGKCIHVVNRLLPFAGREGEQPDFKRWSYIHRDENTGRVPAEVFAKALKEFRAEHGGKITYEDMPKRPGTFLYNDNPQVGESQRPAFATDITAKPQVKKVQVADNAEHSTVKEKGLWEKAKDAAKNAFCAMPGSSWFGCSTESKPVASVQLKPPVKHSGPLPVKPTAATPKAAAKIAASEVAEAVSLAGFSPISLAFSVCETVGFCIPAAQAAAPKKPAGKGH